MSSKLIWVKPYLSEDETFDIIFHPVSNCYVEEVKPIFKECYRILKKGGILLCGLDNGFGYIFDETECNIKYKLPLILERSVAYEDSIKMIGVFHSRILSRNKLADNWKQDLCLHIYMKIQVVQVCCTSTMYQLI